MCSWNGVINYRSTERFSAQVATNLIACFTKYGAMYATHQSCSFNFFPYSWQFPFSVSQKRQKILEKLKREWRHTKQHSGLALEDTWLSWASQRFVETLRCKKILWHMGVPQLCDLIARSAVIWTSSTGKHQKRLMSRAFRHFKSERFAHFQF